MSCSPSIPPPSLKEHQREKQRDAKWRGDLRRSSRELDAAINLLGRGARMSDEEWSAAVARIYPEAA